MPVATRPAEPRAGAGDDQGGEDERRGPPPEALADQRQQAFAGDDAEAGTELVEDDQRRGGDDQDPYQLVAVFRPQQRVGRDPGRVVVGEPGQHPGPDHGEQRGQAAASQ